MSKTTTVTVTDLDVVFDSGVPQQALTLYPSDAWTVDPTGDIVVTFVPHPLRPEVTVKETITLKGQHIRWFSVRDRMHTVKAKDDAA